MAEGLTYEAKWLIQKQMYIISAGFGTLALAAVTAMGAYILSGFKSNAEEAASKAIERSREKLDKLEEQYNSSLSKLSIQIDILRDRINNDKESAAVTTARANDQLDNAMNEAITKTKEAKKLGEEASDSSKSLKEQVAAGIAETDQLRKIAIDVLGEAIAEPAQSGQAASALRKYAKEAIGKTLERLNAVAEELSKGETRRDGMVGELKNGVGKMLGDLEKKINDRLLVLERHRIVELGRKTIEFKNSSIITDQIKLSAPLNRGNRKFIASLPIDAKRDNDIRVAFWRDPYEAEIMHVFARTNNLNASITTELNLDWVVIESSGPNP